MPAPLARGIIIAAAVVVAAGIAAYENPQFREWIDRSREKIAVAFQSTLDDIRSPRPRRDDPSMREDQDEKADERRRQARQEILERGKKLEELRKRRASSKASSTEDLNEKKSPSFDTLVDEDGKLRSEVKAATATSSAVEAQDSAGTLRPRHTEQQQQPEAQPEPRLTFPTMHQSVDAPMLLRQLDNAPAADAVEPWESQYEREMRNTWNIPLPSNRTPTASSHPSESILDLTPTTEDFPDPDYSIPSGSEAGHPLERTEYFSIPPSRARSHSSHTMSEADSESSYYYAHPNAPNHPLEPRLVSADQADSSPAVLNSSAASTTGSDRNGQTHSHIVASLSDFEQSEDDFSEIGDGVRTPGSAWTEVGSTASTDGGR